MDLPKYSFPSKVVKLSSNTVLLCCERSIYSLYYNEMTEKLHFKEYDKDIKLAIDYFGYNQKIHISYEQRVRSIFGFLANILSVFCIEIQV